MSQSKFEQMFSNDPEKYARLSVPFETKEEADEELAKFVEGVSALREKHRISDMACIAAVHVNNNGKVQLFNTPFCFGDSKKIPELTARLFGYFGSEVIVFADYLMSIIKNGGFRRNENDEL